ncbi:MAG TPA: glutathione binding-like protein [Allosphingosinicella sp.]|nr:glutathione binding-like protein [Allosphingosinicella sp.]
MHILYYSPGACSLAPHIVLEETGILFEARRVSIADGELRSADYRAINPKERVPALAVDGEVLTEVPALLAYLASLAPAAELVPPAGTVAFGRCFELMAFLSSSLHIAYAQLWRPERFLPEDFAGRGAFTEQGRKTVRRHSAEIEAGLGGEWALGPRYSIADAYLFPFYRWGVRIGLAMADEHPRWTAWKDRMIRRPAVIRAVGREGIGFDWAPV